MVAGERRRPATSNIGCTDDMAPSFESRRRLTTHLYRASRGGSGHSSLRSRSSDGGGHPSSEWSARALLHLEKGAPRRPCSLSFGAGSRSTSEPNTASICRPTDDCHDRIPSPRAESRSREPASRSATGDETARVRAVADAAPSRLVTITSSPTEAIAVSSSVAQGITLIAEQPAVTYGRRNSATLSGVP